MTVFIRALALALLLPSLAVAQMVGPDRARALLALNGHDTSVTEAETDLTRPDIDDTALRVAWYSSARGLFDADEVMDLTISILGDTLSIDQAIALETFFKSEAGRALTAAEEASQRDELAAADAQAAGLVLLNGASETRAETLGALHDAFRRNQCVDVSEAILISVRFAFLKAELQKRGERSDDSVLYALAAQQMAGRNENEREESIMTHAHTYRDISDAALQDYADLIASDAGQAYYLAINAGFEGVILRDLATFRTRMANALSAESL